MRLLRATAAAKIEPTSIQDEAALPMPGDLISMSGDPAVAWSCLLGGMLLQLTAMVAPFQRSDWVRYVGCAAMPALYFARAALKHEAITPDDMLINCGIFTFCFAMVFQDRLLPKPGEGTILLWTAVVLCVVALLDPWPALLTHVVLIAGLAVALVMIFWQAVPYALKILAYGWFLFCIVAMGVLQYRSTDLSLVAAGRIDQLEYPLAVIDGMAGAYIGVHATFLYELLPIPGKGEPWSDFKARWIGYLDQVESRVDDQRLDPALAVALVLIVGILAYWNDAIGLLPNQTMANFTLFAPPAAWRIISAWRQRSQRGSPAAPGGGGARRRHADRAGGGV